MEHSTIDVAISMAFCVIVTVEYSAVIEHLWRWAQMMS